MMYTILICGNSHVLLFMQIMCQKAHTPKSKVEVNSTLMLTRL